MPQQDYPTYNGIAPSWADIRCTIGLLDGPQIDFTDFSDISCEATLEIGEQRGAGGRIRKRTSGQPSHTAKATLYRSGLRTLIRQLGDYAPDRAGAKRVGAVHFNVQLFHTPEGEDEIHELRVKGCRLSKFAFSMAEGPDADKVEIDLNCIEVAVVENGVEHVID